MAYEGKCGKCFNYEFEGDNKKGYCKWYHAYYYPDDSCNHQKDKYEENQECYITTIICNKLGYEDDCFVLNTLRKFRNDVMQQDEKYQKMLLEYDIIGPSIANCIKEDDKSDEIWTHIYNFYLIPTTTYIMNKEYDTATKRYKEMYNSLKEYYSIEDIDIETLKESYDQKNGGHGKFMQKKSNH